MKFLAWILAIAVFFSSFYVLFAVNSHYLFLTPEKTREMLRDTNFVNQVESVLKKDLFEAEDSETAGIASKNIGAALEAIDFESKVDKLVSDFYTGLEKGEFDLSIDLVDFKNSLLSQAGIDSSESTELNKSIPDVWKVNAGKFTGPVKSISFMYSRYFLILLVYSMLVALFFVICLLISHKYLKLFFWVFIIFGILIVLQRFAWAFINPDKLFESIISQGRSGMGVLVSSFVRYFKTRSETLLLWESIMVVAPSIVGLIIVSVIPEKVTNVPLANIKKN